jgi:hypothetical protein
MTFPGAGTLYSGQSPSSGGGGGGGGALAGDVNGPSAANHVDHISGPGAGAAVDFRVALQGGSNFIGFGIVANQPAVGDLRFAQNPADPTVLAATRNNAGLLMPIVQTNTAPGIEVIEFGDQTLVSPASVLVAGNAVNLIANAGAAGGVLGSLGAGGATIVFLFAQQASDFLTLGALAAPGTLSSPGTVGHGLDGATAVVVEALVPQRTGAANTQDPNILYFEGVRRGDGILVTIPTAPGKSYDIEVRVLARSTTAGGGAVGDTRDFRSIFTVKNIAGVVTVVASGHLLTPNGQGDAPLSPCTVVATVAAPNVTIVVGEGTATSVIDWRGTAKVMVD